MGQAVWSSRLCAWYAERTLSHWTKGRLKDCAAQLRGAVHGIDTDRGMDDNLRDVRVRRAAAWRSAVHDAR